jgi:hypothetical protein
MVWPYAGEGSIDRKRTSTGKGATMYDQFDVTLEDADLLGEVELTTNLIVAASESEEHLSTAEIDSILGVSPQSG